MEALFQILETHDRLGKAGRNAERLFRFGSLSAGLRLSQLLFKAFKQLSKAIILLVLGVASTIFAVFSLITNLTLHGQRDLLVFLPDVSLLAFGVVCMLITARCFNEKSFLKSIGVLEEIERTQRAILKEPAPSADAQSQNVGFNEDQLRQMVREEVEKHS